MYLALFVYKGSGGIGNGYLPFGGKKFRTILQSFGAVAFFSHSHIAILPYI
jgi:hypothetical protein